MPFLVQRDACPQRRAVGVDPHRSPPTATPSTRSCCETIIDYLRGRRDPHRRRPPRRDTSHRQASTDRATRPCQAPHHAANYTATTRATKQLRLMCRMTRFLPAPGFDRESGQQPVVNRDIRWWSRIFVRANFATVVAAGPRANLAPTIEQGTVRWTTHRPRCARQGIPHPRRHIRKGQRRRQRRPS